MELSTRHEHHSALDGLRGLACMMVLCSHYLPNVSGYRIPGAGTLGVALFFTLSSFLLTEQTLRAGRSPGYWPAYFIRRFFRVYPAFFVTLLFFGLARMYFPPLFNAFTWPVVVDHWALARGINRFWTIPVEVHFYLIFPAIMSVVCSAAMNERMRFTLLAVLWGYTLWHSGVDHSQAYLSFFIGGSVAAILARSEIVRRNGNLMQPLAVVSLYLLLVSSSFFSSIQENHLAVLANSWFYAPLLAAVVLSVSRTGGIAKRLLSAQWPAFIGRSSYSLYLVFGSVFLINGGYHDYYHVIAMIFNAGLALAAARLLFVLVESPMQRLGHRLAEKVEYMGSSDPGRVNE